MSHPFHMNRIKSLQPRWRLISSGLLLSALAGCAGTAQKPVTAGTAAADKHSMDTETAAIDQSPIVAESTSRNSLPQQQRHTEQPTKDTDMTILVLDNPELMARSAALDNEAIMSADRNDDSARKPHQMRFHYEFDKHRLSEEDREILKAHAAYMRAHPEVTVQINGHTDNFGSEEYNSFLSRLRASTAAKVLKAEGIRESRITIVGWGSRKPLTNPDDHAANRRLELNYQTEQMAKAQ